MLPSSFSHWTGYLKELYIYIYIYTRSIKSRDYIGRSSSFLVCSLWFLKNAFTFGHYALTVIISWCYIITREWWFRVHFIHAENFSLSTKSNLMYIVPCSEDDLRQLSNCGQWFLFLKETKWLSILENHDNQPQSESHGISNPFPCSRHAVGTQCLVTIYMYIYKISKEDELKMILFENIKEDSHKSPGVLNVW